MQVAKEIQAFCNVCEHLMASVRIYRTLTEDEALLVRHYCKELQETIAPPPTRTTRQ